MRTSRRNQGLQPEVIPEDTESESEGKDSLIDLNEHLPALQDLNEREPASEAPVGPERSLK